MINFTRQPFVLLRLVFAQQLLARFELVLMAFVQRQVVGLLAGLQVELELLVLAGQLVVLVIILVVFLLHIEPLVVDLLVELVLKLTFVLVAFAFGLEVVGLLELIVV